MPSVSVVLLDAEAEPVAGAVVRARLVGLVDGVWRPVTGFADGIVVAAAQHVTGDEGDATLDLIANAEITPENTYWRVTARGSSWVIDVTGDGTVEELLVDPPEPLSPFTVVALGDLTDVDTDGVSDGDALVYDDDTETWLPAGRRGRG